MISGPPIRRTLILFAAVLLTSCSGNVIQTTIFTDGFQELDRGTRPLESTGDPAIYFHSGRGSIGHWEVASTLRQEGFNDSWEIVDVDGTKSLLQTFTNLNPNSEPLSLVTHPMIVAGDSLWKDYTIDVEFTPQAIYDKCGVVFKYRNPTDFYFFGIEGNTVTLKLVRPSVTPLRPFERILDYRPLVWTPGDRFHAVVNIRRDKITTILNDSIRLVAEKQPQMPGRIGLLSDIPVRFHTVEVKLLKGEQRKLNRRKRQITRKVELQLKNHPHMVRWKSFVTSEFGTNQNIRLGDLTGDGNKEILFVRPGINKSPSIAYLCAMNLDGELLWEYGNRDATDLNRLEELPVQIHDLDGDGHREVIFISGNRIYLLDGKNGELVKSLRLSESWNIQSLIFGDLLGTGRDNCIILSDRTGHILVMNERLEKLWEKEVEDGSQPMVYDITGDGLDEVLMGYSVFDPSGNLIFDVGEFIGDRCNGMLVHEIMIGERLIPCLLYAAGDWGLMYCDFEGNLLKQKIIGHVRYISLADFNVEKPGLEIITSNGWGSDGLAHTVDANGIVSGSFMLSSGVSRCIPVNWKGDGEEFFISSADSINGGMMDSQGQLSVVFPSDGHPVTCYMVQDLTGDARDEVLVWDRQELWIYTQDDNPRMGNTYAPHRTPSHSYSTHRMNLSVPGW